MAREATISQEEVNAVADQIRGTGARPTARSVREALGAGSMATVLRLLQNWQARQVRAPDTPTVLPLALQKSLVDFLGQEVAAAKVSLESDLVIAQQSNSDLIAESERQSSTIADQVESIEELHAVNAELTGRLSQMTTDLNTARTEAETQRQAAEAARTEKAKLELRLEGVPRLESEIERLRTALEAERTARVTANQAAAVASAKLEKTEIQVDDLKARLTRAEADARDAAQDSGQMRHQVQTLQASLDVAVRDSAQAKEATRRAEEGAAGLRGQLLERHGSTKPDLT